MRLVKGNVVYVEEEDRPYHAWQIKVVPKNDPEEEKEEVAEQAEAAEEEEEAEEKRDERVENEDERSGQASEATKRRPRVDQEAAFLQNTLRNQRSQGKRQVKLTAKVREAVGRE